MKTRNVTFLGLGGVFALFHEALMSQSLAANFKSSGGKKRKGSRQPGFWEPAGNKLMKRFSEGHKVRGW